MPEYNIAFASLEQLLPFLHAIATALFMGLSAGLWLFAKYFLREHSEEYEKYSTFMFIIRKFGLIVICSLCVVAATGWLMQVDDSQLKSADPMAHAILMTKWGLKAFLALNLAYMFYHYKKARTAFFKQEFILLHESLVVIVYYFIPLNLVVSAIAIYLGVAYRSF